MRLCIILPEPVSRGAPVFIRAFIQAFPALRLGYVFSLNPALWNGWNPTNFPRAFYRTEQPYQTTFTTYNGAPFAFEFTPAQLTDSGVKRITYDRLTVKFEQRPNAPVVVYVYPHSDDPWR